MADFFGQIAVQINDWMWHELQGRNGYGHSKSPKKVPKEIQMWREAYSEAASATLTSPGNVAKLIEGGCQVGNGQPLNCTAACLDQKYMLSTCKNVWNCMALATVAGRVADVGGTVNQQKWNEVSSKFNIGSIGDFDRLGTLQRVRDCYWQSCYDSKNGTCSQAFWDFKCGGLSGRDNAIKFNNLISNYCSNSEDLGAVADADIAGQGVSIAHSNMIVVGQP
ncbi:hypothetical protein QQS21_007942 [Conoideocrella luteorostrata]|uniref:Uncharacterized protein n=1 Tax=Conoideocrella luteorostrata TaxID=1105319 RepID=A0AAJ0FRM3_9HYPO|nr:hypothetical protein QQS21_007942 [Conoideocrella luteorostrata]